jgi:hypothetical protein
MGKTVFVDGNPSQGVQGTIVTAEFLNALQSHRHDGGSQDGSCPINYAADTGTANAYAIALTPALAAHVQGMPIFFKAANANTGPSTIAISGLAGVAMLNPDGTALRAAQITAGAIIMIAYDGASYQLLSVIYGENLGQNYSFDVSAPPANPINVNVRDRLTITFENIMNVPLMVACGQGVYRITGAVIANSTANNDSFLLPNDQTYTNSFSTWAINNSDIGQSSSPYVAGTPCSEVFLQNQSSFFFDFFDGPNGSDTINDKGPCIFDLLISTYTAAKMCRQFGGIFGGPSMNFSMWNDAVTPWTSLGTFLIASGTCSGTIVIERVL